MEMSVRNRNDGRMREGDEREGHPEERKNERSWERLREEREEREQKMRRKREE